MFDIGWGEFIVIGVVALIAIGPKELPGVLRTVGQWVVRIRRLAGDFQSQFQDAMREAELHDLKQQVEDLGKSVKFDDGYDAPYNDPPGTVTAEENASAAPPPSQPHPEIAASHPSDKPPGLPDAAARHVPAAPEVRPHDAAPAQMVPDAGGELTGEPHVSKPKADAAETGAAKPAAERSA